MKWKVVALTLLPAVAFTLELIEIVVRFKICLTIMNQRMVQFWPLPVVLVARNHLYLVCLFIIFYLELLKMLMNGPSVTPTNKIKTPHRPLKLPQQQLKPLRHELEERLLKNERTSCDPAKAQESCSLDK